MALTSIEPQIIYDMDDTTYHAETGYGDGLYVTRSMVATYIKDKPLFKYRYIDKVDCAVIEENDGMRFGQYIEDYILNDDVSAYAMIPATCYSKAKAEMVPWNLRSGQYMVDDAGAIMDQTTVQWMAEHPKTIDAEQVSKAEFLKIRFAETAIGRWWLSTIPAAKKQVTLRWTDEITGLPLQVRIDCLYDDGPAPYQSDLKSTARRLENWNGICASYSYDLQNVMYSDGYERVTGKSIPFFNAVGETTGLMRADILTVPDLQLSYVAKQYRSALEGIAANDFMNERINAKSPLVNDLAAWQLYEYESQD